MTTAFAEPTTAGQSALEKKISRRYAIEATRTDIPRRTADSPVIPLDVPDWTGTIISTPAIREWLSTLLGEFLRPRTYASTWTVRTPRRLANQGWIFAESVSHEQVAKEYTADPDDLVEPFDASIWAGLPRRRA